MIRGRAEALQEASDDHQRGQKAPAPGGVRARTFCLQTAGYAPGSLYRNYFAQTGDSRVRILFCTFSGTGLTQLRPDVSG
jgi:hypothetical protein